MARTLVPVPMGPAGPPKFRKTRAGDVARALVPVPTGPAGPPKFIKTRRFFGPRCGAGTPGCRAETHLGACWSAIKFNAGEGVFEAAASPLMGTLVARVLCRWRRRVFEAAAPRLSGRWSGVYATFHNHGRELRKAARNRSLGRREEIVSDSDRQAKPPAPSVQTQGLFGGAGGFNCVLSIFFTPSHTHTRGFAVQPRSEPLDAASPKSAGRVSARLAGVPAPHTHATLN